MLDFVESEGLAPAIAGNQDVRAVHDLIAEAIALQAHSGFPQLKVIIAVVILRR